MCYLALLCCLAVGCSNSTPPEPAQVDVKGDWTADFLINTTTVSPGKDKNPLGDLSFETAKLDQGLYMFVGNSTFNAVAYAAQGSLQDPTVDDAGDVLYEQVGTIVYRGTWSAYPDEGNTSFNVDVHCEEIMLTSPRTDLQAVCGDPFETDVSVACDRPQGGTTIDCQFGTDDVVFRRK